MGDCQDDAPRYAQCRTRARGLAVILAHTAAASRPPRLGVFQHADWDRARRPSVVLSISSMSAAAPPRPMHYYPAIRHRHRSCGPASRLMLLRRAPHDIITFL